MGGGAAPQGDFDGSMNGQRADWAEAALTTYAELVHGVPLTQLPGDNRLTNLTDLLVDLMHYARRENIDFAEALMRAQRHQRDEAAFRAHEPTE